MKLPFPPWMLAAGAGALFLYWRKIRIAPAAAAVVAPRAPAAVKWAKAPKPVRRVAPVVGAAHAPKPVRVKHKGPRPIVATA